MDECTLQPVKVLVTHASIAPLSSPLLDYRLLFFSLFSPLYHFIFRFTFRAFRRSFYPKRLTISKSSISSSMSPPLLFFFTPGSLLLFSPLLVFPPLFLHPSYTLLVSPLLFSPLPLPLSPIHTDPGVYQGFRRGR